MPRATTPTPTPDVTANNAVLTPAPTEAPPAPTPAPRVPRAARPTTPKARTIDELGSVDAKKMTEAEKILVLNEQREQLILLHNKVAAIEDICNSLARQKQEAEKAYEDLRIRVSENQHFVEQTVKQFANTMLLLGKVK